MTEPRCSQAVIPPCSQAVLSGEQKCWLPPLLLRAQQARGARASRPQPQASFFQQAISEGAEAESVACTVKPWPADSFKCKAKAGSPSVVPHTHTHTVSRKSTVFFRQHEDRQAPLKWSSDLRLQPCRLAPRWSSCIPWHGRWGSIRQVKVTTMIQS